MLSGERTSAERRKMKEQNLILIGMPSAGKSTLGVQLAKWRGMSFLDTDILIQEREGRKLSELIADKGRSGFLELEEAAVCTLQARNTVIATGGSVVYSEKAMAHLKEHGHVIWLDVNPEELIERLGNVAHRGIAMKPGQQISELYQERRPLYEKYADARIRWVPGTTMSQMLMMILESVPCCHASP